MIFGARLAFRHRINIISTIQPREAIDHSAKGASPFSTIEKKQCRHGGAPLPRLSHDLAIMPPPVPVLRLCDARKFSEQPSTTAAANMRTRNSDSRATSGP